MVHNSNKNPIMNNNGSVGMAVPINCEVHSTFPEIVCCNEFIVQQDKLLAFRR